MPSDDLGKRLRERAKRIRYTAENYTVGFDNKEHIKGAADLMDEAATRLATPPGDAVEVAARAIYDEDIAGAFPPALSWEELHGDSVKLRYRRLARAALSSIPDREASPISEADAAAIRKAAAKMVRAGDALSVAAQTTGGTAGRDEGLVEAVDGWSKARDAYKAICRIVKYEPSSIPERAHGEQMREAGGWQPIETAPRDGTVVDLWLEPKDAFECGNARRATNAYFVDGVWWGRGTKGRVVTLAEYWTATHWRPLPLPPAEERAP